MTIQKLDGTLFKNIMINGAINLKLNYQYVDSLNVFPVPDGDTGTNMKMTVDGGINEISMIDDVNIYEVTKKLSRGMLMGARGNSGVILSQLFRGFSKGCQDYVSLNAMSLADAFASGVTQAYKAVMQPVEGTILTVAREASEKMKLIASSRMSINEFFEEYLAEAKASLARTPDLLPVLKEAGVVDSGGTGYICIIEGMLKALNGEILDASNFQLNEDHIASFSIEEKPEALLPYCTKFVLQLNEEKYGKFDDFNEKVILDKIGELGNSTVVVKEDNTIKVHVHTLNPGDIINTVQEYGEFIKLKIENVNYQDSQLAKLNHVTEGVCSCGEVHRKPVTKPIERSKYSVVSVASGDGLVKTFKDMGVDYVVSGGQSMNPSTEDFINGFDTLNADNIVVFPNNKNIQLAALQAAKIYKDSNVIVIPTKTISEGFSALTMLDLTEEPDELVNSMQDVISNVTSVSITYSIRDTKLEGIEVHKDDTIGIMNGKIVASSKRRMDTLKAVFKAANMEEKDIITIIYGKEVTEKEANEVSKYIKKNYSNLEIELIEGDQEVYSYIFAIE